MTNNIQTIWEAPLKITREEQYVRMPIGMEILDTQVQKGTLTLWGKVNPQAEQIFYAFRVYGTGHPILPEHGKLKYIKTVQTLDGALVWHVFQVMGYYSPKT